MTTPTYYTPRRVLVLIVAAAALFGPSCRCNRGDDVVSRYDGAKASCADGQLNGAETDTDCGGPCEVKCEVGSRCNADTDCALGDCENGFCVNLAPPPPPPPRDVLECFCTIAPDDRDGDCEPDGVEDTNGNGTFDAGDFTDIDDPDTDGDEIKDGCEDFGRDGIVGMFPRELDPRQADTDMDGLPDGVEDTNKNGLYDPSVQETDGTNADTDRDGFSDGQEDRNQDGEWNCGENPGGSACELNPRTADTDGDGLSDAVELKSTTDIRFYATDMIVDAFCNGINTPAGENDPLRFFGPNQGTGPGLDGDGNPFDFSQDDQTCPWNADSDGDGLDDGLEDRNADATVNTGETDPRRKDSDRDGLDDGYEDADKNGIYDPVTETDPARLDTDGDGINDGLEDSGGCITSFAGECVVPGITSPRVVACDCTNWHSNGVNLNETDPKVADTDGDGIKDGVEDQNRDGVCQLAPDRASPTPLDESCGYMLDSDGDNLQDGDEDTNKDGVLDLGEYDARRADADRDCLLDSDEQFLGTSAVDPDSDEDGLPDGLEDAKHLRLDTLTNTCEPINCGAVPTYFEGTCVALNPRDPDTDGDGRSDGPVTILGSTVGEDSNADGCLDAFDTNPCDASDVPLPPDVGGVDRDCLLASGCPTPPVGDVVGDPIPCLEDPPNPTAPQCLELDQQARAFACAEGNIRPLQVVRSEPNDYAVALPARKVLLPDRPFPEIQSLFEVAELTYSGERVGHGFRSRDADSATGAEPIRSVFGAVVRLATIELGVAGACDRVIDGVPFIENPPPGGMLPPLPTGMCAPTEHFLISSGLPMPSEIANNAFDRIEADLQEAGFTFERSQGGDFDAHDDQSSDPSPNAIKVKAATDRYTIKAVNGTTDPAVVKQTVLTALSGRNVLAGDVGAGEHAVGPIVDLRIEFYRRELRSRRFNPDGSSVLFPMVQYGAVLALAPLTEDCSLESGLERSRCRLRAESGAQVVADLTNGSSLARFSAQIGSTCELFDPKPAQADFLLVVDDSVSMQDYIRAISRAATDVSVKLRGNSGNLDWRIAMTTSNMGRDPTADPVFGQDWPYTALRDVFEPDYTGGYPQRAVNGADTLPISYQHSAFAADGSPVRCIYADAFDPADPRKSPYCCSGGEALSDADFTAQCCSFPNGTILNNSNYGPGTALGNYTVPADGTTAIKDTSGTFPRYDGNDTYRCFDFPRYSQFNQTLEPFVERYSPFPAERNRHYLDWLCGDLENHFYEKIYGARGYLWPPGFVGPNANPRLDGANLLVRNADQLILQMNRPCGYGDYTPRSAHGSAYEHPMQALKRAVQRAVGVAVADGQATGRDTRATPSPYALRQQAPLFSIILSDEEDYAAKFKNSAILGANGARDVNSLDPAICTQNGDDGCTLAYCSTLFPSLINVTNNYDFRIPGANAFSNPPAGTPTSTLDQSSGSYCMSPYQWTGSLTSVAYGGAGAERRYDGLFEIPDSVDPNDPARQTEQPSNASRDWLNPTGANPFPCTGPDCEPCLRTLRTRQYLDFFGGTCDLPNTSTTVPATEARRYPTPEVVFGGGAPAVPLPTGRVYAITRRPRFGGGQEGACGSSYAGGDGQMYRDVALGTGGKVSDICAATRSSGFVDFLDEVIVDAQGLASPYRLSGKPISSTIRVSVVGNDGRLRVLRRSNVSGFDFNPVSNAIAFFKMGITTMNQMSDDERIADEAAGIRVPPADQPGDYKVIIAYKVWDRPCPEECAVNDVCGLCACDAANPWCCTPEPTFECRARERCLLGCGACEQCDAVSNECRPVDPCGNCGAGSQCNYQTGMCTTCPAGTVAVPLPCGEGCTTPNRFVCVAQSGQPNNGFTCVSDNMAGDCCGVDRPCMGSDVCVLEACLGESCVPKARCKTTSGDPNNNSDLCGGACPAGTVCAPVPCSGESCAPTFTCQSATPPPVCVVPDQCTGTGPGPDCPLCSACSAGQCVPLADAGTSVLECCTTPGVECCRNGETFDPATETCVAQTTCMPACAADEFCAVIAGRPTCIKKGG